LIFNDFSFFCLLKWSFEKNTTFGVNNILSSVFETIIRQASVESSPLKTSVVSDLMLKVGGEAFASWYQNSFFTGKNYTPNEWRRSQKLTRNEWRK
jgi:hypothetical protein